MSRQALGHAWPPALLVAAQLLAGGTLQALEPPQASGYALLSGQTEAEGPLEAEELSTQLHLGLDWAPAPLLAHVHLLVLQPCWALAGRARRQPGGLARGQPGPGCGAPAPAGGRLLPAPPRARTSTVLWENPYAISSSALNTWFGEELRPIGLDLTWRHGGALAGASLFRGNDTFGALPVDRGWALHDRWDAAGREAVHRRRRLHLRLGRERPAPRLVGAGRLERDPLRGALHPTPSTPAGRPALRRPLQLDHALRPGRLRRVLGATGAWRARPAGVPPRWWRAVGESDIWAGYLLVSRRLPFGARHGPLRRLRRRPGRRPGPDPGPALRGRAAPGRRARAPPPPARPSACGPNCATASTP